MAEEILRLEGVRKSYNIGLPSETEVLHGIDLRLERGDATVAVGTLATALFILQLHDRLANLAAPASDALALTLDERRLPQRIRRASS